MKFKEICRNVALNAFKEGDVLECMQTWGGAINEGKHYICNSVDFFVRIIDNHGINHGLSPHFFRKAEL